MIRDLLTRTDLAAWPTAALVGFVALFAIVVARTLVGGRGRGRGRYDDQARLPLEDGERRVRDRSGRDLA